MRARLGGLWRYHVGDWRVICDIEDSVLRVLVLRIGDRKDVYRKARR
ncbi:type II toxin-antitoxin system RelE family toxin [Parvibaculum sp.]